MISETLSFIVDELNEYIKLKFSTNEDRVVLNNISNLDGSSAVKDENKVIVSLVGIQHERMLNKGNSINSGGGGFTRSGPPVYLNLFVLFATSFPGNLTNEALKFISIIIGFFQGKNSFSPADTPSLDPNIDKLIFEIYNVTFQEQNHLWAAIGAKYVPSILYRVRMITIEEGMIHGEITPISEIKDNGSFLNKMSDAADAVLGNDDDKQG